MSADTHKDSSFPGTLSGHNGMGFPYSPAQEAFMKILEETLKGSYVGVKTLQRLQGSVCLLFSLFRRQKCTYGKWLRPSLRLKRTSKWTAVCGRSWSTGDATGGRLLPLAPGEACPSMSGVRRIIFQMGWCHAERATGRHAYVRRW